VERFGRQPTRPNQSSGGETGRFGNAVEDNELLVAGIAPEDLSSATAIDLSFTISDSNAYSGGNNESGAMAYLVETTAAAKNPLWTVGGNFDPFAIYRPRSRWWEVLVSGGASSVTVLKASLTLTPKITSGSTSPAVLKGALTLTPKLVTGTVSSAVLKGLLTLTPKLVSVAGSVFTITKAALALTPKLVTGDLSASAITHSALTLTPKLVPSAPVSAIIVRGSLVLLPKGVSSPSILAGLSQKQDLTVVPYHYSHMPADPATQSTYFMREIRRLQSTINDLHKAANQATDEAPLVPLNGMIRYAKGAWASALGGEGLYVYKAGVWTRIV
jgi:hypothetical protein